MNATTRHTAEDRIEVPGVNLIEILYKTPEVQVLHTVLDPGQEIPWHYHSKVDDIFYVINGPLKIYRANADRIHELRTGELHCMEPGEPHRVCNESTDTVEFLLLQGIGPYDFQTYEGR